MEKVKGISQIIYEFREKAHTVSFARKFSNGTILVFLTLLVLGIPFVVYMGNFTKLVQVIFIVLYSIAMVPIYKFIKAFWKRIYLKSFKEALKRRVPFDEKKHNHWKDFYDYVRIDIVKEIIQSFEYDYLVNLRNEINSEIKKSEKNHLLSIVINNPVNSILLPVGIVVLGFFLKEAPQLWMLILWTVFFIYMIFFLVHLYSSVIIQSSIFHLEELEMDLRDIQNEVYVSKTLKSESKENKNLSSEFDLN